MLARSAMAVVIVPEEKITLDRWEHLMAGRGLNLWHGQCPESATVT